MNNLLESGSSLLSEAGYSTETIDLGGRTAVIFENETVIGFVWSFDTPAALIDNWADVSDATIEHHQLGLRRAGRKAWNTYIVLLATGEADYAQLSMLSEIEENLVGTRKIARAGVEGLPDVKIALLPLLPLQSAPKLETVDMPSEIRQRATELHSPAIDAFLSTADESVVMQILEDSE